MSSSAATRSLGENLFRHYLLALVWIMTEFVIDRGEFTEPRIPATLCDSHLPTDA